MRGLASLPVDCVWMTFTIDTRADVFSIVKAFSCANLLSNCSGVFLLFSMTKWKPHCSSEVGLAKKYWVKEHREGPFWSKIEEERSGNNVSLHHQTSLLSQSDPLSEIGRKSTAGVGIQEILKVILRLFLLLRMRNINAEDKNDSSVFYVQEWVRTTAV